METANEEPMVGLRCTECGFTERGRAGSICPGISHGCHGNMVQWETTNEEPPAEKRWPPEHPTDYAGRKARFAELAADVRRFGESLRKAKSDLDELMPLLRDDMQQLKEQNYQMDGRTYYLQRELTVRKNVTTAEVCKVLVDNGFSQLVTHDAAYQSGKLKSTVRELIDTGQLPPDLADVLYIHDVKVILSQAVPPKDS